VEAGGQIVMVDGRLCAAADATIQVTDEGLLRGDGAFEVIRLYAGRTFALREHFERLARSANSLRLPYDEGALVREVDQVVAAANGYEGAIRVVITRGGRRIIIVEPLPAEIPRSIRLVTLEYQPIGVMRGVKSLSYGANMLLRRLAQAEGAHDALLVTAAGVVLEATTAAFFYFLDGDLFTPPLDVGILDSITRRHVLEAFGGAERATVRGDLDDIGEAFLTSTIEEVHPIHQIDSRNLPVGAGTLTPHPGPTDRARVTGDSARGRSGSKMATIPTSRETRSPTMAEDQEDATWNVAEWHGKLLVDRDGEKIGKLQDVYVDVETDEPQFATVKEGFISRHLTFVPLGGITVGPDELRVVVTKQQVESAPNIEQHGDELSQADESALYHHFELNYTPIETESGRRLARR
jgi:branched-chain amino acid aminotransferase